MGTVTQMGRVKTPTPRVNTTDPPWVGRSRGRSRASRAISFIQRYLVIPSGHNAGDPFKLATFQKNLIEELLADDVSMGAVSIPAGNGKSTLAAALALWSLCDHSDAPQVPLLASTATQAVRTLHQPACAIIVNSVLTDWVKIVRSNAGRGFQTWFNNGFGYVLPAKDAAVQGLNPTVAIIDEGEFVDHDVLLGMEDRLGKRREQVLLTVGTPGPDLECALYTTRTLAAQGGAYRFVEHAAPEGCDFRDRDAWKIANPGIGAGLLDIRALERAVQNIEAAGDEGTKLVLERRFRRFRLGQWLPEEVEASWLPPRSMENCPVVGLPPDGTEVVLAIDGTARRSTALTMASLRDNSVHLLFAGEQVTDEELLAAVDVANGRWQVQEIVCYPTIRAGLQSDMERRGYPVTAWRLGRIEEAQTTNSLWAAITTGTFVHDGNPTLVEHFHNVGAKDTPHGIVLRRIGNGRWIDAAMSARMAWWQSLPANQPAAPALY